LVHLSLYSVTLAEAAQAFPADWTLVMHGWGPEETIERIRGLDRAGRVRVSLDLVPPGRIIDMVASAEVGFALYAPEPLNDHLSALASEKMAYYAQCGVPFIAFDYPSYRRVVAEERWGELISDVAKPPAAIGRILADHGNMREGAHRAFGHFYDFPRQFAPVVAAIRELPARS
jgi:glycosyltransferase involved in cell wall biosynthesis